MTNRHPSALSPETAPPHRIRIHTAGCRVNFHDSSTLRHALHQKGFAIVDEDESADLIILNTCTVTHAADRDARKLVRRVQRQCPDAKIVLTGCYAEIGGESLRESLGVHWVAGLQDKAHLPHLIHQWFGPQPEPTERAAPDSRSRFFYKVQEGCDVRCAFCIIPDARGPARSIPPHTVLGDLDAACRRGHREIILSGIHLGAYGRDLPERPSLAALIERILEETPVERLRLGSIEPWGVRPDLIRLFREEPRLLPSLPLPLQSGCEATLRRMRRPMSAHAYRRLVDRLLEACPTMTLWVDVMAGFPGETEAEFEESFRFIEALPFTALHVFPWSRREGTPAATFPDQVPHDVKKRRVQTLLELGRERFRRTLTARIGSSDQVLVENNRRGHTRDNLPVVLNVPERHGFRGEIVDVHLDGLVADGDRLVGSIRMEV